MTFDTGHEILAFLHYAVLLVYVQYVVLVKYSALSTCVLSLLEVVQCILVLKATFVLYDLLVLSVVFVF